MEQVLVVAKTRMGQGKVCVGGLNLRTLKNVRLLLPGAHSHPSDTPFEIGQVWDVELRRARDVRPPHIEDTVVSAQTYLHTLPALRETLLTRIQPWKGGLIQLFDGCLQGAGNKAFISRKGSIPSGSTGYWLTTLPLARILMYNRDYYAVQSIVHQGQDYHRATFVIPYVGFVEPLPEIPVNTLVRISLCRWMRREDYEEERCYLQISGWYIG